VRTGQTLNLAAAKATANKFLSVSIATGVCCGLPPYSAIASRSLEKTGGVRADSNLCQRLAGLVD
jgi:hypothetical protein